jgi:hypothetical protein
VFRIRLNDALLKSFLLHHVTVVGDGNAFSGPGKKPDREQPLLRSRDFTIL